MAKKVRKTSVKTKTTKTKGKTKAKTVEKALKAIKEKQTKSQLLTVIAQETGVPKKDTAKVLAALGTVVKRHLMPRGSGELTIQDLGVKLRRVRKPARKARKGRNPFTGEDMTIKAKPARDVIRVLPLKVLKDVLA